MQAYWLGRVEYGAAAALQVELAALRADGRIGDTLLLLEHPPTITLGRAADPRHLLASQEALAERGVAVVESPRGGDITWHGPGQLVGYPVVHLDAVGRDLHAYLRALEQSLIGALGSFGVPSQRFPPHTGVWVGDRKVAAIGIKVSRWVATHGFALNVDPDMSHFDLIVPCGIQEYGVTSLARELGRPVTVAECIPVAACALRRSLPVASGPAPRLELLTPAAAEVMERAVEIDLDLAIRPPEPSRG